MDPRLVSMQVLHERIEVTKKDDADLKRYRTFERKVDKMYRKKLNGYATLYIGTNVLGFIPAVISCETPYHTTTIFILIIIAMVILTLHTSIYFVMYHTCRNIKSIFDEVCLQNDNILKQTKDNISKVDANEMSLQDACDTAVIQSLNYESSIKKLKSQRQVHVIVIYWLIGEPLLQMLTGICSFVIVILILHPKDKFESMDLMDIAQIIFTVWLFFVNMLVLLARLWFELADEANDQEGDRQK